MVKPRVLLIGFLAQVMVCSPVGAEQQSLSRATYEKLGKFRALMEKERFGPAKQGLKELLEQLDPEKTYDRAVALETLGYAQAQTQEFTEAAASFRRVLASEAYKRPRRQRVRQTLARIYLNEGRFQPAAAVIEAWLANASEEKARMFGLLGYARLRLEKFADAIPPLESAVRLGNPPHESWLRSLLKAYLETGQLDSAIQVQRRLIERDPDKDRYWRNLISLYMRNGDKEAGMAVAGVAYLRSQDHDPQWLLWLAGLYMAQDRPYRAGRILKREMDAGRLEASVENLEMLAQAWDMARERERAIAALEKAAGENAKPAYWVRIARHHLALGQWAQMEQATEKALSFGQLKNRGQVLVLQGISRFRQERFGDARRTFREASEIDGTSKQAKQWITYLSDLRAGKSGSG